MTELEQAIADAGGAALEVMGTPITYIPYATGIGIDALCFLRPPQIVQPAAPGYFGEIEVDPAVITAPACKDQVVWPDGTYYVVAKVVNPPRGLTNLSLHRKVDKT
jgi:hypothetical protein